MHTNKMLLLLATLYSSHGFAQEAASANDLDTLRREMAAMQQQIDKLIVNQADDAPQDMHYGLKLSGFFDITANVSDMNNHPFQLGDLEVDAVYDKAENFAVSAAGILNEDGASIGVALLDYHMRDHTIPARGALFDEPGYHIQIGRFDIPFANDYSFYAAPDRINISAPLTTERVLDGGLNSDGMRVYGMWKGVEYTAYYTNCIHENTGYTFGGRLGYAINDSFVIGISSLDDQDEFDHTLTRLTALDLALQFGIVQINVETVELDSPEDMLVNNVSVGSADETASHISMALDFAPVTLFVRYETWSPEFAQIPDVADDTIGYAVEELDRVTVAVRYVLDSYLQLKAEYSQYSGKTAEPDFEWRGVRVQMVARF